VARTVEDAAPQRVVLARLAQIPGIRPQDQARLCTTFVRLHGIEESPGMGLGLATVRKAIDLLGGHVGVTSVPGEGGIFWIELSAMEEDEDEESIVDR
jgi:signal transduction histidine kinase